MPKFLAHVLIFPNRLQQNMWVEGNDKINISDNKVLLLICCEITDSLVFKLRTLLSFFTEGPLEIFKRNLSLNLKEMTC